MKIVCCISLTYLNALHILSPITLICFKVNKHRPYICSEVFGLMLLTRRSTKDGWQQLAGEAERGRYVTFRSSRKLQGSMLPTAAAHAPPPPQTHTCRHTQPSQRPFTHKRRHMHTHTHAHAQPSQRPFTPPPTHTHTQHAIVNSWQGLTAVLLQTREGGEEIMWRVNLDCHKPRRKRNNVTQIHTCVCATDINLVQPRNPRVTRMFWRVHTKVESFLSSGSAQLDRRHLKSLKINKRIQKLVSRVILTQK